MARLQISNFGPIATTASEDGLGLIITGITVLTGPQASGKSTVAKVYSTCTYLEKQLRKGILKKKDITQYNRFRSKWLAYHRISSYFQKNTQIKYMGDFATISYAAGKVKVDLKSSVAAEKYVLPKIMYVPAERNFLAIADSPDKLKHLPQSLFEFLEEYQLAYTSLDQPFPLNLGGQFNYHYDSKSKLASISSNGGGKTKLSESSSGLQSAAPLLLVTRRLSLTTSGKGDIHRGNQVKSLEEQQIFRKRLEEILGADEYSESLRSELLKRLGDAYEEQAFINIVEEPEQNLYPSSQKHVLYALLEAFGTSFHNQLLITTHSPYIIDYLTLIIKASQLIKASQSAELRMSLEKTYPPATLKRLFHASVAIYECSSEGIVTALDFPYGLPSDENMLNVALAATNKEFDHLLTLEQQFCDS